jgi:hypothetical protein
MKKCNLKDIDSDATYDRRASTIRWWCERIIKTTEESV